MKTSSPPSKLNQLNADKSGLVIVTDLEEEEESTEWTEGQKPEDMPKLPSPLYHD